MSLDPLGIQVPGAFPTTAIPVPLGLDPLGAGTQVSGAFSTIAAQVPPTASNQSMPDPLAGPISLTGAEASTSSLVTLAPPVSQPIISQGILKRARTQESTASGPSSLALIGPLPASSTVSIGIKLEQKLQDIQCEHENAQLLKDAAINTLTIKLTASDAKRIEC
ncbi:hypothetical protein BDQ17DRAFT_1433143 [Cyathus striatus]|nr:hypothetical protein BDQ17DRAFT_1433143 [Cyathus striatus]